MPAAAGEELEEVLLTASRLPVLTQFVYCPMAAPTVDEAYVLMPPICALPRILPLLLHLMKL